MTLRVQLRRIRFHSQRQLPQFLVSAAGYLLEDVLRFLWSFFAALGATTSAFAIISDGGDVVAWGNKEAGGDGWEQSFLKGKSLQLNQVSDRDHSSATMDGMPLRDWCFLRFSAVFVRGLVAVNVVGM